MTGRRRAEQGENQNSIIWSFFHKLFHSCSKTLERTFGRGRNAKSSCQMKYLVTVSAVELLLIKLEPENMESWTQSEDKAIFTLFASSTRHHACITYLHYYCQHYKYTPWMLNYIIQLGNSLPPAMWLKTKYSSYACCSNIFPCLQGKCSLATLFLTTNEVQRSTFGNDKDFSNTSQPHTNYNSHWRQNTGSSVCE